MFIPWWALAVIGYFIWAALFRSTDQTCQACERLHASGHQAACNRQHIEQSYFSSDGEFRG